MKVRTKRFRLFNALAVLLMLVAGGFAGTLVGRFVESHLAPTPAIASQSDETGHRSSTIETIRVGQRVRTADADDCQNCATNVQPASWRLVRMRLDDHTLPDGTPDPVDIESLQPLSWIHEHNARPGAIVPVPLDLAEMGLPDDLPCRVVSIEACPPIESGSGRVVLNTVTHLNNYLFDLVVRDDLGRQETLRTTGTHKFKSASRDEWVSADTLAAGETLEGLHGPLTVASLTPVEGTFRVYNLTVEGEHVYRVSDLGVLVHNTCPNEIIESADGGYIDPEDFDIRPDMKIREPGDIYVVPGHATPSGKPYVGSTDDIDWRDALASDGRDRTQADIVDHYLEGDFVERYTKETDWIELLGGLDDLDNKQLPPEIRP